MNLRSINSLVFEQKMRKLRRQNSKPNLVSFLKTLISNYLLSEDQWIQVLDEVKYPFIFINNKFENLEEQKYITPKVLQVFAKLLNPKLLTSSLMEKDIRFLINQFEKYSTDIELIKSFIPIVLANSKWKNSDSFLLIDYFLIKFGSLIPLNDFHTLIQRGGIFKNFDLMNESDFNLLKDQLLVSERKNLLSYYEYFPPKLTSTINLIIQNNIYLIDLLPYIKLTEDQITLILSDAQYYLIHSDVLSAIFESYYTCITKDQFILFITNSIKYKIKYKPSHKFSMALLSFLGAQDKISLFLTSENNVIRQLAFDFLNHN